MYQDDIPQVERHYSLEELSQRWDKPKLWVLDNIRRYQFRRVVHHGRGIQHVYFDKDIWPHGEKRGSHDRSGSQGEIETFYAVQSPAGLVSLRLNEFTESLFVPEIEVLLFEQTHGLKPEHLTPSPTNGDFSWIHSKELCLAMESYHALYVLKAIEAIGTTHKQQVLDWLAKHPKAKGLSGEARERIATIVNVQKKGGKPPEDLSIKKNRNK